MVDIVDKTGQPRTEVELLEAVNSLKIFMVQQVNPIIVHFPAIIDAIDELFERRKKDVDDHHCDGVDQLGDLGCH